MKLDSQLDNRFAYADTISDRIIDMLNVEKRKPEFDPMQFFVGQLLSVVGFAKTAPAAQPQEFRLVVEAALLLIQKYDKWLQDEIERTKT